MIYDLELFYIVVVVVVFGWAASMKSFSPYKTIQLSFEEEYSEWGDNVTLQNFMIQSRDSLDELRLKTTFISLY